MRHIPRTIATQHPDNAFPPYWERDGDGFVSVQEEVSEAYSAYADLGCQEFMWDWEGKYVDEAVGDKLLSRYEQFFRKYPIGKKIFLTFRIPNIWHEKGYSLARAFMGILTFETLARDLGLPHPPVFEVILPMCDDARKLIHIQKMFSDLAKVQKSIFRTGSSFTYLSIIPLIEGTKSLNDSRHILTQYVELHKKTFKSRPAYIRPFIARSDPALNAGLVPATLAAKVALSEYQHFSREFGIPVYPIIGVGSLPFRGGLRPSQRSLNHFYEEYAGVTTVTIQSSFRYDHSVSEVKKAIRFINTQPITRPRVYNSRQTAELKRIMQSFTAPYQHTVEHMAKDITGMSSHIPRRRERRLHIGLFGYSRSIGVKKLPRAIDFTAALYSFGTPPELIGVGRGWAALSPGERKALRRTYIHFLDDIRYAARFGNPDNLRELAKKRPAWKGYEQDVMLLQKHLGITFGPITRPDKLHQRLTSRILKHFIAKRWKSLPGPITEAARLRSSLG
ncbi:MAG: phosphoenolpyruvate carboxylase [Candidatus Kerfeldbacteria bacterium RIFCSPLOWO2_01_FULL_48_11]|uniref:Phosphoenolpyruvate carboxylase n=1 Tax=Candidatus Kerfeldbacteria bacterium RIFCSPLOWO2_01_FULL_48_11 TaxID=1798543 RepID=A0A1G2B4G4_9BACT|nr:MAG: Phosphoenolpyruvate carboxylase [Parcubacteria group bacterium GW2011_GWA2_48_9]KKW14544.1 MAG: Phosphoenolpyruvate carboxylase [Parcubacteria group bacterium GW2011_GWC2_49_9]OGY83117.1 MAG: phosphoenolpyruvate carboxylase [Candidatus Kerfeldbacteria bacterium RIFCSPLOWO2_01_FULL_48_11]